MGKEEGREEKGKRREEGRERKKEREEKEGRKKEERRKKERRKEKERRKGERKKGKKRKGRCLFHNSARHTQALVYATKCECRATGLMTFFAASSLMTARASDPVICGGW